MSSGNKRFRTINVITDFEKQLEKLVALKKGGSSSRSPTSDKGKGFEKQPSPPSKFNTKHINSAIHIVATLLTIIAIGYSIHVRKDVFNSFVESQYPGINACYTNQTPENAVFSVFGRTIFGTSSQDTCIMLINKYQHDVERVMGVAKTFIVSAYLANIGLAVREDRSVKGVVRASVYQPIRLSVEVFNAIRDLFEDLLKLIMMMENGIMTHTGTKHVITEEGEEEEEGAVADVVTKGRPRGRSGR